MGETPSTSAPLDLNSQDEARARFGAWIKAAREHSGLSVEAIAQETRISKGHITSLESGHVESLPGKVFGRGFVKNITRLLKTDSAEGLKLYDACWGKAQAAKAPQAEESTPVAEPHKTESVRARIAEPVDLSSEVSRRLVRDDFAAAGEKPRLPVGGRSRFSLFKAPADWVARVFVSPHIRLWVLSGIATLFVLLVFGRWAAGTIHKARLDEARVAKRAVAAAVVAKPVAAPAETMTQEASAIADASTAVRPSEALPADVKVVAANEVADQAPKTEAKTQTSVKEMANDEDNPLYAPSSAVGVFEQVLELNVSEGTEVRLILDGKRVEQTWFDAKSTRFTFHDKAELYLLDASKVDLVYNGKSLGVLGNAGRKRRIFFQAKASAEDFPNY